MLVVVVMVVFGKGMILRPLYRSNVQMRMNSHDMDPFSSVDRLINLERQNETSLPMGKKITRRGHLLSTKKNGNRMGVSFFWQRLYVYIDTFVFGVQPLPGERLKCMRVNNIYIFEYDNRINIDKGFVSFFPFRSGIGLPLGGFDQPFRSFPFSLRSVGCLWQRSTDRWWFL